MLPLTAKQALDQYIPNHDLTRRELLIWNTAWNAMLDHVIQHIGVVNRGRWGAGGLHPDVDEAMDDLKSELQKLIVV